MAQRTGSFLYIPFMSFNYFTLPRLLYFRKDGADIQFTAFREALNAVFHAQFEVEEEWVDYSSPTYEEPNRDNQFIGGWVRTVYFGARLKNGNQLALQYYSEESENSEFVPATLFSFYSVSLYFVEGTDWEWIKECRQKMNPFMESQQFREATFSFTFDNSLYAYFREAGDKDAVTEIVEISSQDIRNYLSQKTHGNIEIQHKAFIEVNQLLAEYPHKDQITSIQLNHNDFSHWPEAIFQFPNLREIRIYHNPLTYADPRLEIFTQLRELNIHSTPLSKDKWEMEQLRSFLPPDCRIIAF